MPQISKVLKSRDEWKNKAVERATELRESRKTEKRRLDKIADLTRQLCRSELLIEQKNIIFIHEQTIEAKKSAPPPVQASNVIDIRQAEQTRILCVLLVLEAVVSFRSIPRILELFHAKTSLNLPWIPHFTSVINWALRVGFGRLEQVRPITQPWLAIIDHSIDIGTKKAMVVLRVTADALSKRGSAIRLKDCECIGLTVHETINGDVVRDDLEKVFTKAGTPLAIIKDADATLNNGVLQWSGRQTEAIPVISDIGHSMANALKAEFEKADDYKNFIATTSHAAKCLRQTAFAFLIPPKLRTKGRFQSISKQGKWGERMLKVFAVKGRAKKGSELEKIREVLPEFLQMRGFIKRFSLTTQVTAEILEILKNKGLSKVTYKQCFQLSKTLPRNSQVKKRLQDWLKTHFSIQKEVTQLPMLVSSDIIESLFGNFKHIIERSPQADMNRSVLLIPALCGSRDEPLIRQALNEASQADLEKWDEENIPYTIRRKRQKFFESESQKTENKLTDKISASTG